MADFVITHRIEAPELVTALNSLADALRSRPVSGSPVKASTDTPAAEKPAEGPTIAPTEAPVTNPTPAQTTTPTSAPTTTNATTAQTSSAVPTTSPSNVGATVAAVKTYTLQDITNAGAALLDAGKMNDLMALLGQHGVQAITQLKPEQYAEVAVGLRALGANI